MGSYVILIYYLYIVDEVVMLYVSVFVVVDFGKDQVCDF